MQKALAKGKAKNTHTSGNSSGSEVEIRKKIKEKTSEKEKKTNVNMNLLIWWHQSLMPKIMDVTIPLPPLSSKMWVLFAVSPCDRYKNTIVEKWTVDTSESKTYQSCIYPTKK